jgi:hypothetical protein
VTVHSIARSDLELNRRTQIDVKRLAQCLVNPCSARSGGIVDVRATAHGVQVPSRPSVVHRLSADRIREGFDEETVFALRDLRIEGNAKGYAVLSSDPEEGPITEFEEEALRSALLRDDGPIEQRAALWLAFAFGTNSANIALLREEDFTVQQFENEAPTEHFLVLAAARCSRRSCDCTI